MTARHSRLRPTRWPFAVSLALLIGALGAFAFPPHASAYIKQDPYTVTMDAPGGNRPCTTSVTVTATVRDATTQALISNQIVDWDFKESPSSGDRVNPAQTITRKGKTETTVSFGAVSGKRVVRATILGYPHPISVRCTAPPPPPTPEPTAVPPTVQPTPTPAPVTPAESPLPPSESPLPTVAPVTPAPGSSTAPASPGAVTPPPAEATPVPGASQAAIAVTATPAPPAAPGAVATSTTSGDGGSLALLALLAIGVAAAAGAWFFLVRQPRDTRSTAP